MSYQRKAFPVSSPFISSRAGLILRDKTRIGFRHCFERSGLLKRRAVAICPPAFPSGRCDALVFLESERSIRGYTARAYRQDSGAQDSGPMFLAGEENTWHTRHTVTGNYSGKTGVTIILTSFRVSIVAPSDCSPLSPPFI